MKRILFCLAVGAIGAGCVYMLVQNGSCVPGMMCQKNGQKFERGSLDRLKSRGVQSLTHLQNRLAGQIAEYPKQAAKLQPLHDGVVALKGKFEAIETAQPAASDMSNTRKGNRAGQQRQPRYPQGSIEALHARGVRILTRLELMIERRLDTRPDQSEELLASLKNDVLGLKQKFEALRFSK